MPHPRSTERRGSPAAVAVAVLTAGLLTLSSCGIFEDDPPPPAETPAEDGDAAPGQGQQDPPEPTEEPAEETVSQQGVSAGHPIAADVGEEILAEGGNAVDAAVASAFAVSIVEPYASGIGGGGSAIVAGAESDPLFYDYREVVNESGDIPDNGTGIPGFVAGMSKMHEDYGSLEWERLIQPAQEIAAEGFEVSEFLADRMNAPDGQEALADIEHYAPGGEPLQAGEELVQTDLADTLSSIAENGAEEFYTGGLAESLVDEVDGVDSSSLADYEVVVTDPVRGEFGDREILGAPPSLPGAAMIQMLQIAEAEGIADLEPGSAEYTDTLSKAWLEAEETVYNELGDPNFVQVPLDDIIDPETNAQIDLEASSAVEDSEDSIDAEVEAADSNADVSSVETSGADGAGGAGQSPEPASSGDDAPNTTHISVVDSNGLSVSMTNTIMYFWGSGEMVDGYFLNNHLARFDEIDSSANEPEPGRRTVTWSNPATILDSEGRPELVMGSPGGHQILNIMGSVLAQWGLQDRSLEEAIELPRFRAEDDTLLLEASHSDEQIEALEDMDWDTEVWPDEQASFGSIQPLLINYDDGTVSSVDDQRREGAHRIID